MAFGTLSLKGKALQCLSQREHSRAELREKLLRHAAQALRKEAAARASSTEEAAASGFDAVAGAEAEADTGTLQQADVDRVLDELAAAGFQSDVRAAESLARRKSSRYGARHLRQQLQAKGLDAELVAHTVSLSRDTEFERAQSLWARRFGEPAQDATQRARQIRFLLGRGFDGDVVRRVVRGAVEPD